MTDHLILDCSALSSHRKLLRHDLHNAFGEAFVRSLLAIERHHLVVTLLGVPDHLNNLYFHNYVNHIAFLKLVFRQVHVMWVTYSG